MPNLGQHKVNADATTMPSSVQPTPKRRGPIVTLARLWAAVPIPSEPSANIVRELHDTFIRTFIQIMVRDQWVTLSYNIERWDRDAQRIVGNPTELKSLTVLELRDYLTYCCRLERINPDSLYPWMVQNGGLQRVLSRFAMLIWPRDGD